MQGVQGISGAPASTLAFAGSQHFAKLSSGRSIFELRGSSQMKEVCPAEECPGGGEGRATEIIGICVCLLTSLLSWALFTETSGTQPGC